MLMVGLDQTMPEGKHSSSLHTEENTPGNPAVCKCQRLKIGIQGGYACTRYPWWQSTIGYCPWMKSRTQGIWLPTSSVLALKKRGGCAFQAPTYYLTPWSSSTEMEVGLWTHYNCVVVVIFCPWMEEKKVRLYACVSRIGKWMKVQVGAFPIWLKTIAIFPLQQ